MSVPRMLFDKEGEWKTEAVLKKVKALAQAATNVNACCPSPDFAVRRAHDECEIFLGGRCNHVVLRVR